MSRDAVKEHAPAVRMWGAPRQRAARTAEGRPRRLAGRIALSAAIAVCAAVAVFLGRGCGNGRVEGQPAPAPAPRPARAKVPFPEIAPATQPAPAQHSAPAADASMDSPELRTYRDARGVLRYEGGLRVPGQRPLARPIELGAHRPKVFRHAAEEHISWLLDMKAGEPVVGDYAYGDDFRRSFRESLGEPVEILDTDDARTRELKAAVQETKEELRRRMAAGEDVAKAMNDALDECRRLARYRRELQERLCEIRADVGTYGEREVEDFTKAANELLAREGLPPLTMPRTVMRGLLRR